MKIIKVFSLLYKNWLLHKRTPFSSIMVILVPIICMLSLIPLNIVLEDIVLEEESMLNSQNFSLTLYGNPLLSVLTPNVTIFNAHNSSSVVGLGPANNPMVKQIVDYLELFQFNTKVFESNQHMNQYMANQTYDKTDEQILFAFFLEKEGSQYKYRLRFKADEMTGVPLTNQREILEYYDNWIIPRAYVSGAMGIIAIVNNLIFQQQILIEGLKDQILDYFDRNFQDLVIPMTPNISSTQLSSHFQEKILPIFNQTEIILSNKISPIYQQNAQYSKIYFYANDALYFLVLLPLIIIYGRQTELMLYEKERGIRQNMQIMGMGILPCYVSWFITYFLFYLILNLASSAIFIVNFPGTPFLIPFVTNLLMHLLLIFESIFIQIFFKKSKLGMIIALLFFTVQFLAIFLLSSAGNNPSTDFLNNTSISAFVSYVLIFRSMIFAHSFSLHANISDEIGGFEIINGLRSIGITAAIFLGLIITIELIQQFYQKLSPKINNETDLQSNPQSTRNMVLRSRQSDSDKIVVRTQKICKKFHNFVALNNINIQVPEKKITIILGENGAGKSTLINLLTGLLKPSSGSLTVNNTSNMREIRKNLGFCPQFDALYDQLTVEEHLNLYCKNKGIKKSERDKLISNLLEDVQLEEKRKQKSKNLSGGQRRRLSVAIAFVGPQKIIILDEPTSGMDVKAQRKLWAMLQKYKKQKSILISTHTLQQEDIHEENIIILSKGNLVASTTISLLRKSYGQYHKILIIKQNKNISNNPIIDFFKDYFQEFQILFKHMTCLQILVPYSENSKLSNFLSELNSNKGNLKIKDFFISALNLEEVYQKALQSTGHINYLDMDSSNNILHILGLNKSRKWPFYAHLPLMLKKRLKMSLRQPKILALELFLPFLIVTSTLLIMYLQNSTNLPIKLVSFDSYTQNNVQSLYVGTSAIYQPLIGNQLLPEGDFQLSDFIIRGFKDRYGDKVDVNLVNSLSEQVFDEEVLFPQKIQKSTKVKGGLFLDVPILMGPKLILPYTSLINTKIPSTVFSIPTLGAESIINGITGKNISISVLNQPLPKTIQQTPALIPYLSILAFSITVALNFSAVAMFITKQRVERIRYHQIMNGMNIYAYKISNYMYDLLIYLILAGFMIGLCFGFNLEQLTIKQAAGYSCCIFILFGFANIPFIYILCEFIKNYQSAQGFTFYFHSVLGGIAPTVILVFRIINENGSSQLAEKVAWVLRPIPIFCFGQGLINLAAISFMNSSGERYKHSDFTISLYPIIMLAIQTVFYFLIFMFVDIQAIKKKISKMIIKKIDNSDDILRSSKVLQEKQKALSTSPKDCFFLMKNIVKGYYKACKPNKVILRDLSLAIQRGTTFGLLGVNGAGKTTTFKILTGQITATSGTIHISGFFEQKEVHEIRNILGYCPQFDPLIGELNVYEQLEHYYGLKNFQQQHKTLVIESLIRYLGLDQYQQRLSTNLSGGNKRKLSLAIALLGNPELLLLDEPSTGMDPVSKRFIWNVISNIINYRNMTIILTSHSMEQIQKLTNKIGIMESGDFRLIQDTKNLICKNSSYEIELKISLNKVQEQSLADKQDNEEIVEKSQEQKRTNRSNQSENNEIVEKKLKEILEGLMRKFSYCEIIESTQNYARFRVIDEEIINLYEMIEGLRVNNQIAYYSIKKENLNKIFQEINEGLY